MKKSKDWDFPVKKHRQGMGPAVLSPELVYQNDDMRIERIKVVAGWMYITTAWFEGTVSVSTCISQTIFAS